VTASANSLSVTAGSNNEVALNVAVSGGFSAAIAFSVTGLPNGVSASFTPATLSAPGSGASVLKLTASGSTKAGVYSATVSATSGATKQQVPLSVTCSGSTLLQPSNFHEGTERVGNNKR
jgi:uncharacterized membrane protein